MAEYSYQSIEAWNTAVKLAVAVGRLKIGSNLKASNDAQAHAFEQAGMAAALIAEGSAREGQAMIGMYRDARGALAQCRSWLHVLAAVTNEQDSVFGNELDLAEQAARQIAGTLRTLDRAPMGQSGPGPGPGTRLPPRPAGPQPRDRGPR